jgi:uncharacterized protein DUF1573
MKKIVLLSAFFIFGITASNAQEIASNTSVKKEVKKVKTTKKSKKAVMPKVQGPGMVFENETIDYGTIAPNSDGKREFVFTNNGTEPLIIMNAQGSCGCTVPTFPKEPIAPGAKAVIGVKYDTSRAGQPFNKTVTLTTNIKETPTKTLTIKGTVLPAETKPTEPVKVQEVKS